MRKVIFLLIVILSLPTNLWAADPIIGAWKLNLEKSGETEKNSIKELIEDYKEIDSGLIELTRIGTWTDGSPISGKYTTPKQGGEANLIQAPRPKMAPKGEIRGSIIGIFVSPFEYYTVFLRDGKQVQLIHKTISDDGKTMNVAYRSMNPNGSYSERKQVFEKQ